MHRTSTIVALATNGLFAFTTIANAEIRTVCASGCQYTSINAAMAAASDGDVIQLSAETYAEGSVIDIGGKVITLRGVTDKNGDPASILDGGGTHRVLSCDTQEGEVVLLQNLRIQNGYERAASGILAEGSGTLHMQDCTVTDCEAHDDLGGGLYLKESCIATIEGCTFSGNAALFGGGICKYSYGDFSLRDCVFSGNFGDLGGALWLERGGADTVTDCTFTDNSVAADFDYGSASDAARGGAVYIYGATDSTIFEGCTFSGNQAEQGGGAIFCTVSQSHAVSFTNCTISGNTADYGGGFALVLQASLGSSETPVITFDGSTISGNTAVEDGGGILAVGDGDRRFMELVLADTAVDANSPNDITMDTRRDLEDQVLKITVVDTPVVAGDLDGDGDYDEDDIRLGMVDFGISEASDCRGDVNGDGIVNAADLGIVIGVWGNCP